MGRGVAKLLTLKSNDYAAAEIVTPSLLEIDEFQEDPAMKLRIATTLFALAAAPALVQSGASAQMTGVSKPDTTPITDTQETMPAPVKAKPAAGIPMAPATGAAAPEVYGPYVPYHAPGTAGPLSKEAFDPDANIVATSHKDDPKEWQQGIVMSVPEREGEIREGTLVKARTLQELATDKTAAGSTFKAELTEAVEKDGKVILPVGAILEGRVTAVHGGKRISGKAMLHLEPSSVTLPDGTQYLLHAQLIDTAENSHVKIGSEGDVLRRDHPKETLAVVGGVTGAGAIAGGLIGGGVGAAVGASIGAGAGTIVWLKQDRQATLPQDSLLVFSLTMPMELKPLHVGATGGQ
jgi:hypothetical protein